MRIRDLAVGDKFRFHDHNNHGVYVYIGDGWYRGLKGGGPWHDGENTPVVLALEYIPQFNFAG